MHVTEAWEADVRKGRARKRGAFEVGGGSLARVQLLCKTLLERVPQLHNARVVHVLAAYRSA